MDDIAYWRGPLLGQVSHSHILTSFTEVMMSALVIVGLIFRPRGRVVLGLTWISLGLFLLYILHTWLLYEYDQ